LPPSKSQKDQLVQDKPSEPVLLLGEESPVMLETSKSRGGGQVAHISTVCQPISKALVACHQKYLDEASKKEMEDLLIQDDQSLLGAERQLCESRMFGIPHACARYQKSYQSTIVMIRVPLYLGLRVRRNAA
uniref:Uncharacterized protein n=1 Tax=Suricata suricatta TaxID=37032 RepID=A0A673SUQ0_SURSU